jgi:uridine kinase
MIAAPSSYSELHAQVSEALGPCRNPILIGFDGRDGEGKTSAATWLAWQFGMPAIHLDLFIRRSESESAISWRTDDLARCLKARDTKPIIIEGVLLLEALATIEKSPDYLVFVEKAEPQRGRDRSLDDHDLMDTREFALSNQISRYFERHAPSTHASFKLVWSER